MKRSTSGWFTLALALTLAALAAGLWACGSDPTDNLVGTGLTVQSDPTSLFLVQGSSEPVTVTVNDAQGNEIAITDISATAAAPAISVVEDTAYLRTNAGAPLATSRRFNVTGVSAASTSIAISANGQALTVPVRVTPTTADVTLSSAAPAVNEPVVVTLPADYKFGAGAGVNVELGDTLHTRLRAVVESLSVDSTAATILPPPGNTGVIVVDSVGVGFAPGVLFSLPTSDTVTVGPLTPLAGTGAPGSAPALTIPAVGATAAFYDGGTFAFAGTDGPSRLYKFTVAAADTATLTTTLDWPSTEDLGIYFYGSDGVTPPDSTTGITTSFDGPTAPESGTNTFGPGTYFLAVVNSDTTGSVPPYFSLKVTREVPVPPAAE